MTLLKTSICEKTEIQVYIQYTLKGEALTLFQEMKEKGYNLFDKNNKFRQFMSSELSIGGLLNRNPVNRIIKY